MTDKIGIPCHNTDADCFHPDKCEADGRCPWNEPAKPENLWDRKLADKAAKNDTPKTGNEVFRAIVRNEDPVRVKILEKAKDVTLGDRDKTYGEPYDNLSRSAALLNAMFGTSFSAADVSIINGLLKLGRKPASPLHEDHYIDMANYFGGMPYECELERVKREGDLEERE